MRLNTSSQIFSKIGEENIKSFNSPQLIPGFEGIKISSIAVGFAHNFATTDKNEIFCWGCNNHGQLGLGHTNNVGIPTHFTYFLDRLIKVFAFSDITFATTDNGKLFGWGSNSYKRITLTNIDDILYPLRVYYFLDCNVIEVAGGASHCVALVSR